MNNRGVEHDAERLQAVCLTVQNREPSPPVDCISREERRIVRQAVHRIRNWRRRRALILFAFGYTLREIADRLKISSGVAHNEKHAGLRQLQAMLPPGLVIRAAETMRTLANLRKLREDDGLSWAILGARFGVNASTAKSYYKSAVAGAEGKPKFIDRISAERPGKAVAK